MKWQAAAFLAAWAVATVAGAAPAGETQLSKAVGELLGAAWGTGDAAAIDAFYERAQAIAPRDARVPYALALAHMRGRRFDEAQRALDAALTLSPNDFAIRRAKIWIDMLARKHPAALVGMRALAERIPKKPVAGDAEQTWREAAAFLGRMHGFCIGPAANDLVPLSLTKQQAVLRQAIGEHRQNEFTQGADQVARQYQDLLGQYRKAREQSLATAEKRRMTMQADAQRQRNQLQQSRQLLAYETTSAQARFAAQQVQLRNELESREAELRRLFGEGWALRDQLDQAKRQARRLSEQANLEKDADKRRTLAQRAKGASQTAEEVRTKFNSLKAQSGPLRQSIAELQARLSQQTARQIDDAKRLAAASNELEQSQSELPTSENRTDQAASDLDSRTRSLAARMETIATYERFPLRSERDRILASFRRP